MSDPASRRAKSTEPPGRWLANTALVCVPLAVFTRGLMGIIGIGLAVAAMRKGDRQRGKVALIALIMTLILLVVLGQALKPPEGPLV